MAETLKILESAGDREGVRILRLIGPCTLAELFDLKAVLRSKTAPITLLDVTDVPYMDSASLGCVLGLHVSCEERKTKYAVIGASDRIKTLFRVTKVDSFLVTYPTVAEALQAL